MRSDILLKTIDATAGRMLCGIIGWWDYWRSKGRSPGRLPAPMNINGQRLLIIRPGGMGDMILLLPALKALEEAFPNAAIDMLCENRNAGILEIAGFRGTLYRYDRRPWRLWKELRKQRYAVVVDTEQFHNLSAVTARLTGAPCRIGFKINPARNLLYTHLINYALDAPESDQFMRLLAAFDLSGKPASVDGILADALRRFSGIGEPSAPPGATPTAIDRETTIAVYAGAVTPHKRWPTDRFHALIERLVKETGMSIVLVGGREAQAVSQSLAQPYRQQPAGGPTVVSRAGETTLAETAVSLANVRLFIGIDCGLTHLAAAVGTPTITLFGPSDPLKWGHQAPRHRVLQKGLTCSPCFIFGYHRLCRSRDCMTAISVDDVMAACRASLE